MRKSYKVRDVKEMYSRRYARAILRALQTPNQEVLDREVQKILRKRAKNLPKNLSEEERKKQIKANRENIEVKLEAVDTWAEKFAELEKCGIKMTDSLKDELRTKSWGEIISFPELREKKISDKMLGVELRKPKRAEHGKKQPPRKLTASNFVKKVWEGYRINSELDEDLPPYDKQSGDAKFIIDPKKGLDKNSGVTVYAETSREIKEKIEGIAKNDFGASRFIERVSAITNGENDYLIVIRIKKKGGATELPHD